MTGIFLVGVVIGFGFGLLLATLLAASLAPDPPPKHREPVPRKRPEAEDFYRPGPRKVA
jgi:hypothetical protein